jgi:hypothetical protein
MTIKTTISTNGVVQTNNDSGFVVEFNTSNQGFLPFMPGTASLITSNVTMSAGNAGLVYISGASAPVSASLPAAANCAGAMFTIRSTSNHAHVITGSSKFVNYLADREASKISLIGINQGFTVISDGHIYHLLSLSSGSSPA